MTTIACPTCNAPVDGNAHNCPNCGMEIPRPRRSLFGRIWKWAFILFNVATATVACYMAIDALNGSQSVIPNVAYGLLVAIWMTGAIILGALTLITPAVR